MRASHRSRRAQRAVDPHSPDSFMFTGELRCRQRKLFGIVDAGVLEVRCQSKFCGQPGVVVIHRFDLLTGEMLDDKLYRDPATSTRGITNGSA